MDFIIKNYLIIILIGLFFVFALIGYLIDMLRRPKSDDSNVAGPNIKTIEVTKEKENVSEEDEEETVEDELLNKYNNVETEKKS